MLDLIERLQRAQDADIYTDAPEMAAQVEEAQEVMHDAAHGLQAMLDALMTYVMAHENDADDLLMEHEEPTGCDCEDCVTAKAIINRVTGRSADT